MDKIAILEKISEMLRELGDNIVEGIEDEAVLCSTECGIIASLLIHCKNVTKLIRELEEG